MLITKKREEIEKIREEETIADGLCKGITEYAIKLNTLSINEKEHQEVASILQIVSDIERVSDYCENISEFAENLRKHPSPRSQEKRSSRWKTSVSTASGMRSRHWKSVAKKRR